MNAPDDIGFLTKTLDWAWALVLGLVGLWHRQNTTTLREIKDSVALKADRSEVEKQGDTIGKVFDRMRDIELNAVASKTQLDRIVSHLESEGRTRAEANREIMGELRSLRQGAK